LYFRHYFFFAQSAQKNALAGADGNADKSTATGVEADRQRSERMEKAGIPSGREFAEIIESARPRRKGSR
jgi:hypothetical protein